MKEFQFFFVFVSLSKKEEGMKRRSLNTQFESNRNEFFFSPTTSSNWKIPRKITYFSYLFLSLANVFFLLTHLVGNIHSTWVQCVYLHPIHFWKDFNRSLQDHLSHFSSPSLSLSFFFSFSFPLHHSRSLFFCLLCLRFVLLWQWLLMCQTFSYCSWWMNSCHPFTFFLFIHSLQIT